MAGKPRSRAMTLLLASGLWLLYFDLVTSMPGCTDSSPGGPVVDAAPAPAVDSAPEAVDAPLSAADAVALIDAPVTDAPPGDAPSMLDANIDGGIFIDGAALDASFIDGTFVDAPSFIDASFVDAFSLVDAPPDA